MTRPPRKRLAGALPARIPGLKFGRGKDGGAYVVRVPKGDPLYARFQARVALLSGNFFGGQPERAGPSQSRAGFTETPAIVAIVCLFIPSPRPSQAGDKIASVSASFGEDVWVAENYGSVMYAIRTRSGQVYLKVRQRARPPLRAGAA